MSFRVDIRFLALAAFTGLIVAPAAAEAGPRDEVIDALVQCANLKGGAARLACFDRNTPALRSAAGTPQTATAAPPPPAAPAPPAPAGPPPKAVALAAPPPVATKPPPKPKEKDERGGSWLAGLNPFSGIGNVSKPTARQMAYQPIGEEILPVTIAVKDFYVPPGGAFTVTLINGQVWRAVHGYTSPPHFRDGETNLVTIDHAMLGGYNLSLRGRPGLYKVERMH